MRPLVRPLFFGYNVLDMLFTPAPRHQPPRPPVYQSGSPSPSIYPSAPSSLYPILSPSGNPHMVHSDFRPASTVGAANANHVATWFFSNKPTPTPPVLPSIPAGMAPSHLAHMPHSSGATLVSSRLVPAPGTSTPTPGPSGGTLYSSHFRPAKPH